MNVDNFQQSNTHTHTGSTAGLPDKPWLASFSFFLTSCQHILLRQERDGGEGRGVEGKYIP